MELFICANCRKGLKLINKEKQIYKCDCWNMKDEDIPPITEIFQVMSEHMKETHTFH